MEVKRHWLGKEWYLPGSKGNNMEKVSITCKDFCFAVLTFFKTNVPNIRLDYRHETLQEELDLIELGSASPAVGHDTQLCEAAIAAKAVASVPTT